MADRLKRFETAVCGLGGWLYNLVLAIRRYKCWKKRLPIWREGKRDLLSVRGWLQFRLCLLL
ncbi:hypothetical protein [Peribacillus muralis]|uniref:hypothetical protein n=1 Tax=Peribacillus muralis TaxID=264697 RepID=UPI003D00EDD0